MDIALLNAEKNKRVAKKKHKKQREPYKSFYQYLKTDQNLPNKNVQSNKSSGKRLPVSYNKIKSQSVYQNFFGKIPGQKKIHTIIHKTDIVDQIVKYRNK